MLAHNVCALRERACVHALARVCVCVCVCVCMCVCAVNVWPQGLRPLIDPSDGRWNVGYLDSQSPMQISYDQRPDLTGFASCHRGSSVNLRVRES